MSLKEVLTEIGMHGCVCVRVKERDRQMLGCPLHENRSQPVNTGPVKDEEKQQNPS